MSQSPVCAITGSNGYVASCIKTHLRANGWEILEMTRKPRADSRASPFQLGAEVSPQAFAGVNALVHCAYDFRPLRWDEIRAVNVDGTQKLFQAAQAAGVQKIATISTISAYEGCRSLYGRAKLEIEKITLDHGALAIRPGLVYGDKPGGMFGKLAAQIRRYSVIPLIGSNAHLYLVHDEDLSGFIRRYVGGETRNFPFVLTAANEERWAFRNLLLEIARGLGKKIMLIPLPWQLAWAGMKSAETCGLRLNFRSDSLVSLMYQNPRPDLSANSAAGLDCRPLQIETVRL
jgi:nucleoside-diphosphate-sugar epimerase